MSSKLSILAIAAAVSVVSADATWAQGRGPSSNRGLGQAAASAAGGAAASQAAGSAANKAAATRPSNIPSPPIPSTQAAANSGRGQVQRAIPRGNPQVGDVAAGWNRGQSGLRQSTDAFGRDIAPPQPLPLAAQSDGPRGLTPEQIRDQRIQRAEHLRAISERNGNESLLETADRMEGSALENYQRQTTVRAGLAEDESVDSATPSLSAAKTNVNPAGKPRRGFWFRFR